MKRGFTLIELIVVVSIIAIMALAAVTKFSLSTNKLDAVARVLRSDIQLAQDFAMTHGSTYGFRSINTTSYEIFENAPGTPATDPLTRGTYIVNISPAAFSGVVPTISFSRTGVPSNVADAAILLTGGDGTRTVTVKKNTGLVTVGP